MKNLSIKQNFIIRLKKGDEVVRSILELAHAKNIKSAFLHAIGAVSEVELAIYDLETKSYSKEKFAGKFEIASLSGNIGRLDGNPVAHIHGVFSKDDFSTVAGHINSATVGATCEICLTEFNEDLERKEDKAIGLNLLDI